MSEELKARSLKLAQFIMANRDAILMGYQPLCQEMVEEAEEITFQHTRTPNQDQE